MKNDLENIKKLISNNIAITDEEWALYSPRLKVKTFEKKDIILEQGQVCKHVYFVEKGLLRIFFVDNDGVEKTFHFSMEGTFATDYESFLKNIPSTYSIQALENSKVILTTLDLLEFGYKHLTNGEKLGRLLAEKYFFIFSDKIQSIYTESSIERYNNLNIRFPGILQRVPQHLIASYLNISPVHLSRLKNTEQ